MALEALMEDGRIHAYIGGGKGKTTAAAGLAARAAGAGKRVLFCQFLKNGRSSELKALERAGVEIFAAPPVYKFVSDMDGEERSRCAKAQREAVYSVFKRAADFDVIVLDELLDVVELSMIAQDELRELLTKRAGAEIVLTGRRVSRDIYELCSYISDIREVKHPFANEGLAARKGIEF